MIHLLAYLLVRRPDGSWSVSSHRKLEGVAAEWEAVRAIDEKSSAIVHVGFWRPDASSFAAVCLSNEGKVLLTSAAKFALPSSYRSAINPLSIVDGLPIYLALSGWGYEIEEDSSLHAEQAPSVPALASPTAIPGCPSGWIEMLEKEDSDLFGECSKLSILSESLYQEREALLPSKTRDRLASYRFKQLSGYDPSRDIMVDGLMFAPPWILRLSTKSMDLPLRARIRLAAIRANAVSDIARIGAAGLMRIEGLGRKSLMDISKAIFAAFELGSAYCVSNEFRQGQLLEEATDAESGQQEEPKPLDEARLEAEHPAYPLEPKSFRDALHAVFSLLGKRDASVLRQRMGIGGGRKTLEEIARNYSLTRERVRQIEAKAVNRILDRMSVWVDHFRSGLGRMIDGRGTPLPLLGLEVLDFWFAGADTLPGPFEYSLEHLIKPPEFGLLRIGGQAYVSRLRQDEWEEAERAAKALLSTWSKKDTPPLESDIRLLVESQLVGKGEELRPLLWEVATRWAHFSSGPSGERILVSFGMGAESLVEAVLSESDIPLHYSDIAKRCAMKGRSMDMRLAHNAATNVGYLLGRGIYGLEKHIDLSKEEQERVLGEVEDMLSETPGRQWHAGEICDELEARGLDFEGRLSRYDLNVILGSSTNLSYLRRMIWATRTRGALGAVDRLNIWQAIVALVQQHGSPMLASDIREIISRDRGLGSTFQIHQADPLIRVGENEWGIIWRDIPFDENHANAIVDEMISVLEERGSGLHISEIIPSLKANRNLVAKANPILLVALAIRTERFKSGKGRYVYLSEWEGPRRLTVSEAVEKAFDTFNNGVLAADVAKNASELLGREVANNAATSILMKIGTYDPGEGMWFHPEEDTDPLEEPTDVVTM
jgi:hypothetical protein